MLQPTKVFMYPNDHRPSRSNLINRDETWRSLAKALTHSPLLRNKSRASIDCKLAACLPVIVGAPGTGKSAMLSAITPRSLLDVALETGCRFMPELGQPEGELLSDVLQSVQHIVVSITFNFSTDGAYLRHAIASEVLLRIIWA